MATLEDAKRGLRLLKDEGMKKLNFAGGEPFLYPEFLGKLVQFCKQASFPPTNIDDLKPAKVYFFLRTHRI